mgnify:FL=1
MKSVYLIVEVIELAKNDFENSIVEAHTTKDSAIQACKDYKEQGMDCWIKPIKCISDTKMQQKLNLL